ncbi:MAG: fructosamine kinase family protein [bacterium]
MDTLTLATATTEWLTTNGYDEIREIAPLQGGVISQVLRVNFGDGATVVVKQHHDPPPGLYACEAEGLRALRVPGGPTVPEVYAVGEDFLVLEDLGSGNTPQDGYWENFGHAVATLHRQTAPQFGFHADNYLGKFPMNNSWQDDGYAFYAETRILDFLSAPLCLEVLTAEDRANLERLAARLPQLMPPQPAVLLHGDLWHTNMLVGKAGEPAFVDPATYYGWAEADLTMSRQYGNIPEAFFAAYQEVNPLPEGWWERLDLFTIKEHMSMIAHFGDKHGNVGKVRELLARFL